MIGAAIVLGYAWWLAVAPWHNDAYGFYVAWDGGLYDIPWLEHGAYVYAPPFAQAIGPLLFLPWEAFWAVWVALQTAALLLMAGPVWGAVILLLPWPSLPGYPNAVVATIWNGNPQLLLALGIAAGYRWPAAWALPLLMKVTPAIGLLWFVVRREWRRLAIAVGATAAISLVSAVFAFDLWGQWLSLLTEALSADTLTKEPLLPLVFAVRLPIAAALIAWGAWTDRYWTVPIGCMLALPAIALGGFAVAVAAIPFLGLPLAPRWASIRASDAADTSALALGDHARDDLEVARPLRLPSRRVPPAVAPPSPMATGRSGCLPAPRRRAPAHRDRHPARSDRASSVKWRRKVARSVAIVGTPIAAYSRSFVLSEYSR